MPPGDGWAILAAMISLRAFAWAAGTALGSLFLLPCSAQRNIESTSACLRGVAKQAGSDKSLPKAFESVIAEIKGKSSVPILLPDELPPPFASAKQVVVDKAAATEWAISLYYERDAGDASLAAFFAANSEPKYRPTELGNVSKVKLSRGLRGYFRPVSCGGSCAPANIWWEQSGTLYQFQLKMSSTLSEKQQQKTMCELADSAISAGPR